MTGFSLDAQIAQLEAAIAGLEGQRAVLGDIAVDTSIAALRAKLAALTGQEAAGQRRLVTVLFCDLVDFTPMAERMDPEDVHEVLDAYFQPWRERIAQYGGRLEKFIGDAVMAIFGVPVAAEDDAERAIRAALGVLDGLEALNAGLEQRFGVNLALRIGIHTGTVLAAQSSGPSDLSVAGETVALASRLEGVAPRNGILISHDTYRHVRGVFDVDAQEPVRVKGLSEPVLTYAVQQARPRAFHRGMRGVEGVETRMIGRGTELRVLQDSLYAVVREKQLRVVTVLGEAGIGKSRLMFEFENWADVLPQRILLFKGRASQERQGVPYGLVRDLVSFRLQIQDSDSPSTVRAKLEQGFGEALAHAEQTQAKSHFIGQLLGFDLSDSPHLQDAKEDARQLRERAQLYLADYFRALTHRLPTAILLEDLHWADSGSLDLLDTLFRSMEGEPLLVFCLARPGLLERQPGWGQGNRFQRVIHLGRLSVRECKLLVDEILRKAQDVPDRLRDLIVSRTEGNPFYVEELIKMLIEDGVIVPDQGTWRIEPDRLGSVPVPPTLAGVLQARLDRLPSTQRSVLQRASVVGRRFWDRAVAYLTEPTDRPRETSESAYEEVASSLAALRVREMVFRRPTSTFEPSEEYTFKHDSLREVAYESVLKRVRRSYHALVASWLQEQGGERVAEYAGLIADHLEAAGQTSQAAAYLMQAGEQAAARFANAEAVDYLGRALGLTPETETAKRYDLLLARERVYDVRGARREQAQDLAELGRLARGLSDDHRQATVALRKAHYAEVTGDLTGAAAAAQDAIELARGIQDVTMEAAGYRHWGRALWHQGASSAAVPILEQALTLAHQAHAPQEEAQTLRDLGVASAQLGEFDTALRYFERSLHESSALGDRRSEGMILNNLGIVFRIQGDYQRAAAVTEQSLSIRRAIGDRRGEAVVLNSLGLVQRYLGNYEEAMHCYQETVRIARQLGDRWTEIRALGNLGNILSDLGDQVSAMVHHEQALQLAKEIGSRSSLLVIAGSMAMTSYRQGNYAQAIDEAESALRVCEESGNQENEAHIHLTLGHSRVALGSVRQARAAFERGLELSHEIGQSCIELEALAGLAQVSLGEGNTVLALSLVERMVPLLANAMPAGTEHDLWAHLVCYRVLEAVQDPRACEILRAADALLQERAAKIQDPELRRSYLENIHTNRELEHLVASGEQGG